VQLCVMCYVSSLCCPKRRETIWLCICEYVLSGVLLLRHVCELVIRDRLNIGAFLYSYVCDYVY